MFNTDIDALNAQNQVQTPSSLAKDKLNVDFNSFITLLVTQLQNQDPLDPLDATEFTSQLVQFASVEQLIKQNTNLEKILSVQQTSQVASLVNYIGTIVEVFGNEINLEEGIPAEFTYTLETNAADVTITISNSDGLTVFTTDGEREIGQHEFIWDGKNNQGVDVPADTYTVTVSALDNADKLLTVKQTVFGRVTGAGAEDGLVNLFLGDVVVPLKDVLAVRESPQPEDTGS